LALVVGNDECKLGKLATAANDAGLMADALTAAGVTVTGARNTARSVMTNGKQMGSYSSVDDTYTCCARGRHDGYEQFSALYPSGPYSQRIGAMLAVRREEII
jgi:hypothetical protein